MTTAIYTRFSPRPIKRKDGAALTEDAEAAEIEKIQSINTQIESCQRYCSAKGLPVIEIIRDPMTSARSVPLKYREGGAKLLELIASGSVKHIVVQKIDRLFRNVDERSVLRKWQKMGVSLHLADQGGCSADCSTATGMLFLTMLMTFAEFEPALTAERTRGAMLSHQRNGRAMGGKPPYGFSKVGEALVENGVEQLAINEIRYAYKTGRKVSEIVDYLNNNRASFPPRADRWHKSTVKSIIAKGVREAV